MDLSLKTQAKNLLFGLLFVVGLIFIIRYFHIGLIGTILLLCGVQVLMTLYKWFKSGDFHTKELLKGLLFVVILVPVVRFIGKFGTWGFIITVLGVSGIILWRKWPQYIQVKHHIESMIWGKPLKDFETVPKLKLVR